MDSGDTRAKGPVDLHGEPRCYSLATHVPLMLEFAVPLMLIERESLA